MTFIFSANLCPVCGYQLHGPVEDADICPSCGTQFGYTDSGRSFDQLRESWIRWGMSWSSRAYPQPRNWNPYDQLIEAGYGTYVPAMKVNPQGQTIVVRDFDIVTGSVEAVMRG